VVILRVTAQVLVGYADYLPPDFNADFLRGREDYFFNGYHVAFYIHLVSGPLSLLLGLVQLSSTIRLRWPTWHRRLGRLQAVNVIGLVVPSGLGMAYHTMTGPVAGIAFGTQALLTGVACALGWRAAVRRRFADHEQWMMRCFLLLCGAVVLRVASGTAVVLGVTWEWFDPIVSWAAWIVPLLVYEMIGRRSRRRC
jgi:hypothetical protein